MIGAPHTLRTEHLDRALGIHTTAPRLSWRLPAGAAEQVAYRLRADNGWDTGWVTGSDSVLVRYTGPTPRAAQRVRWQVRVRTDAGDSAWSGRGATRSG